MKLLDSGVVESSRALTSMDGPLTEMEESHKSESEEEKDDDDYR
jgi:hypothetical protein